MGKPDALSRREDHSVGIQDDNKMVLVIPPEQIASTTLQIATDADDIRNRIRDATVQIRESDVITLCKKHGICEERDGVLFTRSGRMYVPEDRDLRMEIVRLHHDTPISGHPGTEKTLELIQRSYTWPGMPTLVKDYVSRCCYGFSSFPLIFVYLLRLCFLVPLNRYIFSFPTCIASHCSSQPRV